MENQIKVFCSIHSLPVKFFKVGLWFKPVVSEEKEFEKRNKTKNFAFFKNYGLCGFGSNDQATWCFNWKLHHIQKKTVFDWGLDWRIQAWKWIFANRNESKLRAFFLGKTDYHKTERKVILINGSTETHRPAWSYRLRPLGEGIRL